MKPLYFSLAAWLLPFTAWSADHAPLAETRTASPDIVTPADVGDSFFFQIEDDRKTEKSAPSATASETAQAPPAPPSLRERALKNRNRLSSEALARLNGQLIYAVSFSRADDVRLLLEQGALPDAKNIRDWSVISIAIDRNDAQRIPIIKVLLEAGVSLEARDKRGDTPLMAAIGTGNVPLVELLISQGADIMVRDAKNRTTEERAIDEGYQRIQTTLRKKWEAIRRRKAKLSSPEQRQLHLQRFSYYNCAHQYMYYYLSSGMERDETREVKLREKLNVQQQKIKELAGLLRKRFRINPSDIELVAQVSKNNIFQDLERLISNRNRFSRGVGKNSDLQRRCKIIAGRWETNDEEAPPPLPSAPLPGS